MFIKTDEFELIIVMDVGNKYMSGHEGKVPNHICI